MARLPAHCLTQDMHTLPNRRRVQSSYDPAAVWHSIRYRRESAEDWALEVVSDLDLAPRLIELRYDRSIEAVSTMSCTAMEARRFEDGDKAIERAFLARHARAMGDNNENIDRFNRQFVRNVNGRQRKDKQRSELPDCLRFD